MSGKIFLSDEERTKIVKDIHESYKREVRMIRLSDEECRKIAQQVHEDFERISKRVAQDMEILNKSSHERAVARIEQERQDKKLINKMKPSLIGWLFGLFNGSKNE